MTKTPTETTKTRVEDRLKIMVGEGLELSRKAQAAHDWAAQVQLQYATEQNGVTLADVRAANEAHQQTSADEVAHKSSMAPLEATLAELARQERERELLAELDACRAELDRLELDALRRLEVTERAYREAVAAWPDVRFQAERVRVHGRVTGQHLAQLRGQPSGIGRRMTVTENEHFLAGLERYRLQEEQKVKAPEPLAENDLEGEMERRYREHRSLLDTRP
ncbi:hypothetical protein [Deinococcus sp. Leaf326]|uniref:hypothetical protein n=1 Tax=Deinococcus sp. Leaf326 TaxID=1736338 RepID=UPI0006FF299C|nr:hypothetical protein [Deinococcus sp. Leaf326]KQR07668.1 hypothetical protein ASF71_20910 [Deinococcus sp. Leaf326]